MPNIEAQEIINLLRLEPHPEGGFFSRNVSRFRSYAYGWSGRVDSNLFLVD